MLVFNIWTSFLTDAEAQEVVEVGKAIPTDDGAVVADMVAELHVSSGTLEQEPSNTAIILPDPNREMMEILFSPEDSSRDPKIGPSIFETALPPADHHSDPLMVERFKDIYQDLESNVATVSSSYL
jgi:hypothetical protein